MPNFLIAENAALLPLAIGYALYFIYYQYLIKRRLINPEPGEALFATSILIFAVSVVMTSFLSFAVDTKTITRTVSDNLAIIPRGLLIGGFVCSYWALNFRWKTALTMTALALGIIVYFIRICIKYKVGI